MKASYRACGRLVSHISMGHHAQICMLGRLFSQMCWALVVRHVRGIHTRHYTATPCNTMQHIATHCIALQHTATHCNTMQHIATHRIALQHTATHCKELRGSFGAMRGVTADVICEMSHRHTHTTHTPHLLEESRQMSFVRGVTDTHTPHTHLICERSDGRCHL